jgi:hypothetical protein
MSPAKRQPSKQKRTAQNRQQRAALEARKAAAGSAGTGGRGGARASRGGGSVFGRLFGGGGGGGGGRGRGGDGAGSTTARPAAGLGAAGGDQPVGFRAALAGLLAAVAAIILTVLQTTPVNADGDLYTPEKLVAEWSDSALAVAVDQPEADADAVEDAVEEWSPGRGSERLVQALWPASLAMALPVLAAYLAFRAVQQRRPSRTVNRAMYATLFGALLTFNLFIFFLPSVVAISIAGFQVRKAEATAAALAAAEAGDGATDAEVVDAELADDDAAADERPDDER